MSAPDSVCARSGMICSDLLIISTFYVVRTYAVPSFLRTPQLVRVAPKRLPAAEISGDRLDEGQLLVLTCRRAGGRVSWEFSSNISNPYFTETFKETAMSKYDGSLNCEDPEEDGWCDEEILKFSFTKNLAGLYRCIAPPRAVFNVLWINQTLSIEPQIVPDNGYGKSVSIPCNALALPSEIGFDRVMTWSYTDPSLEVHDVASCCGGDYIIEAGESPGPAALVIRSFNTTRHAGKYRCTVKIDGYPKELTGDAIVYAEVALTFSISYGNRGTMLVLPDFLPNEVVKIRPTEKLIVSCIARGYPQPHLTEMYETNSAARGTTVNASSTSLESRLEIGRADNGYRATFVCQSNQTGIPFRAGKESSSRMMLEALLIADVEDEVKKKNVSTTEINEVWPTTSFYGDSSTAVPDFTTDSKSIASKTMIMNMVYIGAGSVTAAVIIFVVVCQCKKRPQRLRGGSSVSQS